LVGRVFQGSRLEILTPDSIHVGADTFNVLPWASVAQKRRVPTSFGVGRERYGADLGRNLVADEVPGEFESVSGDCSDPLTGASISVVKGLTCAERLDVCEVLR
jgi:hypothetical protein